MVRGLEGEDLDEWLKAAEESNSSTMRSFATGLKKDLDAVRAGLTEQWDNSCVEGFIHKLKLLMRQATDERASSCSEGGCWPPENTDTATLRRETLFHRERDRTRFDCERKQ